MATPIEIFYSYAPLSSKDERLVEELDKHLILLKQQGQVTTWSRRDILGGVSREEEVARHLSTARIILLFVSLDFMNSEPCQQVDVEQSMRRNEVGEAHVIPIILSSVIWEGAAFGKLQCLPRHDTITTGTTKKSQALYDIAKELSSVVEAVSKEDPDLHKAFERLVGPNVLPEQRDASQKIINMLRQLSLGQRRVNKLKIIHNMLQKLESPLDSLTAILNAKREELLDYQAIQEYWQQVVPRVDDLLSFASDQMQFIEEKDQPFQANPLTGPQWAAKLFLARKYFAISLDEKASWNMLVDLARSFLAECLQQLSYIDDRLLQEVTALDYLAEQILRSTNYGEPRP